MKFKMKIIFAWFNFFIGAHWDRKMRILYFFPLPMIGLEIKFGYREITCCPQCFNETMELTIYRGGSSPSLEYTVHWFEGYGKCSECDWQGYYSDSD